MNSSDMQALSKIGLQTYINE